MTAAGHSPRQWPVWSQPGRVLWPVFTVELTALVLGYVHIARVGAPTQTDILRGLILIGAGVLHSELARGVERTRRRITPANGVDLSSVWTFAAAMVLPAVYAGATAVIILGYMWVRSWRLRTPLYRIVFSTTTVVLSCFAASAAVRFAGAGATPFDGTGSVPPVIVAMLAYTTVNSCLVAGVIALSAPTANLLSLFASWHDNVLELGTLCLGGFAAAAISINPWLVLLVLPPLLLLHQAALVRQLITAAATDAKTGLLTAEAWHTRAERTVTTRPTESVYGVLLCDLDHFKAVNDTYGHLAGDQVLVAAADVLRTSVRDGDLVGRFGGEEFVLLLLGDRRGGDWLDTAAERIRRGVAALHVEVPTPDGPLTVDGLTISIGGVVAHRPVAAPLRVLMEVADRALYEAKRAGRNRVRIVRSHPTPMREAPDSAS